MNFVTLVKIANQVRGNQAEPVMTRQARDHLRNEQDPHPVRRRGLSTIGLAGTAAAAVGTVLLFIAAACTVVVYKLGVSEINTQISFMYSPARKTSAIMMPISPI